MAASSIGLSPHSPGVQGEALAGAAGILPGHLIIQSGVDVVVNATAEDVPVRAMFADISTGNGGDITKAYLDNETVHYRDFPSGALVMARFAVGITLAAVGLEIASAGDGTLKAPAVAGVGVLGYIQETIAAGVGINSGAGFAVIRIL